MQHVHSLGPERVALPELKLGSTFFNHMTTRETPESGLWRSESYHSVSPALFVVTDATVHSSPGIIAVGDYVVASSLDHTGAVPHRYDCLGPDVRLQTGDVEQVPAVAACLLAGSCESIYHWYADAVGRLGVFPANYRQAATVILVSGSVPAGQRRLLEMLPLPEGMTVRVVRDGETLRVRTLLVPTSVSAGFRYHPCIRTTLRGALGQKGAARDLPQRFYIDRRGAPARRLVNERELVARLAPLGIVPVALETLTLDDQIALFRSAELVVAPHGAGLANCVFASPGCRVIELLMDSYVNWCFRNLAGLCGLDYDCVIGRTLGAWPEMSPAVHGSEWMVSVPHVVAAVAGMAGRG